MPLSVLLLLLQNADAHLRGFQAQEPPPTVSCGQQPDTKIESDGFDELALLQREVVPSQGMHQKSHEEWLSDQDGHESKISGGDRKLDSTMVAGQLEKLQRGDCADDPLWRDADGDGCEIYKFAIESNRTTIKLACNGGGAVGGAVAGGQPDSALQGERGSEVVADATAKIFCPVTCGMCKAASLEAAGSARDGKGLPDASAPQAGAAREAEGVQPGAGAPSAEEATQENLDGVAFLQVGVSSATEPAQKSVEYWAGHAADNVSSRIPADQRTLHEETVSHRLSTLAKGKGCADDPLWRDADGDGCEIYKFVIESGKSTRDLVCNGGGQQARPGLRGAHVEVVADATAKVFCPVTCGVC